MMAKVLLEVMQAPHGVPLGIIITLDDGVAMEVETGIRRSSPSTLPSMPRYLQETTAQDSHQGLQVHGLPVAAPVLIANGARTCRPDMTWTTTQAPTTKPLPLFSLRQYGLHGLVDEGACILCGLWNHRVIDRNLGF